MQRYRVVIVRDLSHGWDEPDTERVVRAVTISAAAKDGLAFPGWWLC